MDGEWYTFLLDDSGGWETINRDGYSKEIAFDKAVRLKAEYPENTYGIGKKLENGQPTAIVRVAVGKPITWEQLQLTPYEKALEIQRLTQELFAELQTETFRNKSNDNSKISGLVGTFGPELSSSADMLVMWLKPKE